MFINISHQNIRNNYIPNKIVLFMGNQMCQHIENTPDSKQWKTVGFYLEETRIKSQRKRFFQRKAYNSYILPVSNLVQLSYQPCTDRANPLVYFTIQILDTDPLSLQIVNAMTQQQKISVLLVMLYGFGQLYRATKKTFKIIIQMIKYDNQGKIYVWYNTKDYINQPQFEDFTTENEMISSFIDLLFIQDMIALSPKDGFIETIVKLKTQMDKLRISQLQTLDFNNIKLRTKRSFRSNSKKMEMNRSSFGNSMAVFEPAQTPNYLLERSFAKCQDSTIQAYNILPYSHFGSK